MTLLGVALGLVFVMLLTRELLEHHFKGSLAEAILVTGVGTLISYGCVWMGWRRIVAGVRGHAAAQPSTVQRAESWYTRHWFAIGLGFWAVWVLGALVIKGPGAVFLRTGDTTARIGWYGLLWYVLLPVHVALHELGHASAGALLGFRFVSLRVGWLTVQRDTTGYRWTWGPAPLAGILGLHAGVPTDARLLRARTAAWAAAGPLTTLLVALVCHAGAAALGDSTQGIAASVAEQVLRVGWWLGLVGAMTNALPVRTAAGYLTDGGIVRQVLAPMSPARRALFRFQTLWSLGRRPRDWGVPAGDFLKAAKDAAADRDALLLAAASVALDTGDDAHEEEILARAVDDPALSSSPMRYELELQAAMLAAFRGRTNEARERMARAGPHGELPAYPLLAKAVVDACDGQIDAAAASVAEWERAVEGTGRGSVIRVGNDWAVDRLRTQLARRSG